jgi:hypothetical protein
MATGPTIGHVCQELLWGAAFRWGALVCRALGDGVAVACTAVRLGLVPGQLVEVILEELVASRPVLIALQAQGNMMVLKTFIGAPPCVYHMMLHHVIDTATSCATLHQCKAA